MATKRIPMRKLREVLRLRLHAKLSLRQIGAFQRQVIIYFILSNNNILYSRH